MKKSIGNVVINYEYYDPDIKYSDGDVEEVLLEAAKDNNLEELLYTSSNWAVLYHCSDMRENLLEWYPFKEGASLLEVGSGCGALTGLFAGKLQSVTCIEMSERRSLINAYRNQKYNNIEILLGNFQNIEIKEKYDYITLIGVWEYAGLYLDGEEPYLNMLRKLKTYLKPDGKLLIAIENKMGLKYWNGAPEDHTGKMYSGLNDYVGEQQVCTFTKPEIENLVKQVGFTEYKFYYPNPDYKLPDTIFSDEKLPQVGELRNYRKDYNAPRMYNFNDAIMSDQICRDNMYPYFANSFLVECGTGCSNVVYAKYSRIRKRQYRIATVISHDENDVYQVHKKPLDSLAYEHIEMISNNKIGDLGKLRCVEGNMQGDEYVTKFIKGQTIASLFYRYRKNAVKFVEQVKEFVKSYLSANEANLIDFYITPGYEKIFGTSYLKNAKSLQTTNIDLIFSNIICGEDKNMYCIDNEWIFHFPIPVEYTLWRAVTQLYAQYACYLSMVLSKNDFLKLIGINLINIDVYMEMEKNFSKNIIGKDYRENYRKSICKTDFKFII